MAVTNNIREIREQRGIYQDDLAAAIGYSTKTVGRIERGNSTPSAEFMLRISKYFNMLVEDVFHVEDWVGGSNSVTKQFFITGLFRAPFLLGWLLLFPALAPKMSYKYTPIMKPTYLWQVWLIKEWTSWIQV